MVISPITIPSPSGYDSFEVLERTSVKEVLEIADTLEKWEETARLSQCTADPALRLRLVRLANLCSLIYIPLTIAKESLLDKRESPTDEMPFPLTEAYFVDEPVILVSVDERRIPQAIGVHDKKTNELLYLLTNPKNLIYRGSEVAKRGTGSSIITYLAKKTLDESLPLIVKPTPDARKFYLKHNFQVVPSPYRPIPFSFECHPPVTMSLTAAKIAEKISKGHFS